MRAAILHGKEDLRIEDIESRPLRAGEVGIAIEAALTCGTDLKVFKRGQHARMITPPSPFGHELAGVISEVSDGAAASGWKPGDRVVVANSAPCGNCPACRRAQENLCDDLLFLNGAYAESIAVPARLVARNLLRLQQATGFVDAALTEPLACVVQGVTDVGLGAGQCVMVIGAGPIGLMFVAIAKHLGCEVVVLGRGANRLAAAERLGADRIFDTTGAADLVELVRASSIVPPDVVIEAVGRPETWEAATRLVRKGGIVNFFGGCPAGTRVSLDTALVHYSSLRLVASFHHTPTTIRRALGFIEMGVIRAADFVDGECPLSAVPELFRSMAAGNRAVKTRVRVCE